jgi:hypothetical protein
MTDEEEWFGQRLGVPDPRPVAPRTEAPDHERVDRFGRPRIGPRRAPRTEAPDLTQRQETDPGAGCCTSRLRGCVTCGLPDDGPDALPDAEYDR